MRWFRSVITVARHELRILFSSWTAYTFIAVVCFFVGVLFSFSLAQTAEGSLRVTLSNLALTLLFCVPFVTMNALAGERRKGTLEGLLATGVEPFAVIIGKWLAGWILCMAALCSTLLHAGILINFGVPDLGVLFANYVGLMLCCSVFVAGGLVASALSSEPMAAGVGGVLLLLPFWLAGVATGPLTGWMSPFLGVIALELRLRGFGVGSLALGHVLWFGMLSAMLLGWAWAAMEYRRWR